MALWGPTGDKATEVFEPTVCPPAATTNIVGSSGLTSSTGAMVGTASVGVATKRGPSPAESPPTLPALPNKTLIADGGAPKGSALLLRVLIELGVPELLTGAPQPGMALGGISAVLGIVVVPKASMDETLRGAVPA